MTFAVDLEKYFAKTAKRLDDVSYNATVLMFSAVVFDTPVGYDDPDHVGTLKGNWIPSIDTGITEPRALQDPTGEAAIEEIKSVVQPTALNILSNNLPYAPVVEYGLYPNPPKKPTGKTQGGYSIQAPFGMITPNLLKWDLLVQEAVKLAQ